MVKKIKLSSTKRKASLTGTGSRLEYGQYGASVDVTEHVRNATRVFAIVRHSHVVEYQLRAIRRAVVQLRLNNTNNKWSN